MTRVLVVDDDPEVVTLVEYKLNQQGFGVESAGDGQQALDKVAADPPELILLDIMMPGLSGLDVLENLRSNGATVQIPVIMLTAKAQEDDVARGFSLGADDYIIKPFSLKELMSRINAVLTRAKR